eukprot:637103-Rhodomonas_salina.1
MHGQDVLLHELQWAFQQGVVASIIKTFASRAAVGLSAGSSHVQHSRHLLRDLPWAFRPGVVACNIQGICFATCSGPFCLAESSASF